MSVAIPIPLLQNLPDVNVTPAVGVDENMLVYDHDTARFVLRAPFAPFDGTPYALLAGRAGGQTLYGGTGADDDITIHGTSDGTRTTSYVLLQPMAGNVGVGTIAPAAELHVATSATTSPRGVMSSQHSASVDGARFHMRKSRGTNASPTVITTGDTLGRLVASGFDGTNYLEMGGIDIVAVGTIASTRVPTEIRFLTATDAAPSVLTQRMVIDKAGKVGIGTGNLAGKLSIYDATAPVLRMVAGGSNPAIGGAIDFLETDPSNVGFGGSDSYGFRIVYDGSSDSLKIKSGVSTVVTDRMVIARDTGLVGIGTTAPATLLHAISTTATTNALRNVLTLGVNVTDTGVGAAGLGAAVLFQAESTTTVDTTQAAIEASWIVATHATRTSRLALKAYDTAEREGIRIDASGTAALLGFYGHAAAAQPSAYTPSNVSADRAFDADTVLVAELADVVGTLIADLQSIGLLA